MSEAEKYNGVTLTFEEVMQIIDEAKYELLDGINMQYHARTFTQDEYDTIRGVIHHVEGCANYYFKTKAKG